jgi:hypothetical protein
MAAHADAIPHVPTPKFYFGLSLVFALVAFGGFTPSYVAPPAGQFPPIVHLHAVLFFAWTILLIAQARLAQSSLQTHRALGLAGISLATAMVFTALAVIVRGLGASVEAGTEAGSRTLSIVPVFAITSFAVFFALAVANVRRPESHKRFVVLATVALLPAAMARVLFRLFAPPDAALLGMAAPVADVSTMLNLIIVPALLADALLIAAIVYDWRTRGRPHRVYVIGGLCLVGSQLLRPAIAPTAAWQAVTSTLLSFGGQ